MKKIFFSLLVLSVSLPVAVSAVTTEEPTLYENQEGSAAQIQARNRVNPTKAVQKAVAGAIARCPMIESRLQMKVVNFDNNKLRHMESFVNMQSRLAKLSEKLASKGADVSVLQADLSVLGQKIDKFSTDYSAYITKLKGTQTATCGKIATKFKTDLKGAKAAMQLVHQDILDIRAYFVSTIKPDLQAIRVQLSGAKATTTAETVNSSTEAETPENPAERLTE